MAVAMEPVPQPSIRIRPLAAYFSTTAANSEELSASKFQSPLADFWSKLAVRSREPPNLVAT